MLLYFAFVFVFVVVFDVVVIVVVDIPLAFSDRGNIFVVIHVFVVYLRNLPSKFGQHWISTKKDIDKLGLSCAKLSTA